MNLPKEKIIEQIKEAREYGLKYSQLAREINLQPTTIYMFMNGTYNLSIAKQLQAVCIVEKYIDNVKKQLKQIQNKEIYVKWIH